MYVLADRTKLLPVGYPQILDDDRPGDEVWPEAPGGVTVWNRYFEMVSAALVTGVVTEDGVQTPEALDRVRRRMEVPAGLEAWAAARSRSGAAPG